MHDRGFGYETTTFVEDNPNGGRRIAAFVFWRGGGYDLKEMSGGIGSGGISAVGVAIPFGGSPVARKLTLPFRYLALAIVFPVAWLADAILSYRERQRFKGYKFVPMSSAMQEARQWARYKDGILQINTHKLPVPAHSTLVVFVEDDASQDDDLAITTHRIATEAFIPEKGISDADRERLRASQDKKLRQELARKMSIKYMRGPGQMMLAIHRDPVCGEFMRRAAGAQNDR
jgi:hypothetical protein